MVEKPRAVDSVHKVEGTNIVSGRPCSRRISHILSCPRTLSCSICLTRLDPPTNPMTTFFRSACRRSSISCEAGCSDTSPGNPHVRISVTCPALALGRHLRTDTPGTMHCGLQAQQQIGQTHQTRSCKCVID